MDKINGQNTENIQKNISDSKTSIESKTQKIVTAIYMVSDLIKEGDPIRKDLRKSSVLVASLVQDIAIQSPSNAKKNITNIQNYIDKILTLLEVAVTVGFLSDMNFKIITQSLIFVKDDLNKKYHSITINSPLSSTMHNRAIQEFILPDFISKDSQKVQESEKIIKVPQTKTSSYQTDKNDTMSIINNTKDILSFTQREDRILAIIKEKKDVSVSDVSIQFPEISEKTIQRMLIKLVEQGTLTKIGEKRWSRYSVVS